MINSSVKVLFDPARKMLVHSGCAHRLEEAGKYESALTHHFLALKSSITAFGAKSNNVSMHHERIARCYQKLGKKELATEYFRKAGFPKH
ncbi:MAG TPA: tetratricopeptide repeat protein [Chlamydiales bacterium]|nr:tetratricopeptide repeat protein [Chlamydiales bacterium]